MQTSGKNKSSLLSGIYKYQTGASPSGWKLSKNLQVNRKIRDVPHSAPPAHPTAFFSAFTLVSAPTVATASGLQAPLQQEIIWPGLEPGQLSVGTVCVPFAPADFVLGQELPRLQDDTGKVIQTINRIFRIYNSTWADVQHLFEAVFTPDEKIKVWETSGRWAAEAQGRTPWSANDLGRSPKFTDIGK